MKKFILAITILAMPWVQASDLQFCFNLESLQVFSEKRSPNSSLLFLKEPGVPRLPYICYHVIIPYGERVENIDIDFAQINSIVGEYDIPPVQKPSVVGETAHYTEPDPEIYGSNSSYPYKSYELVGVERLAGFDIAMIVIYPYKYNPVLKKISYNKKISVKIRTSPDELIRSEQSRMICWGSHVIDRLYRLVINPEAIYSYPSQNTPTLITDIIDPDDPCRFLIITGSSYQSLFNDYASWKADHGVTSAVFTIEDIYQEYYSGADNAENIRLFIKDAYLAWADSPQPLEYVLLAGDDEIIPVRGCWGYTDYFGTDYHIPCDFYFGALDGDWNANGNQYYGEVDDEPDLFGEVHIGRFPGDNLSNFQNMIYKIQQYVENPPENIHSALMVGELLDDDPLYYGGDFLDLICDDPQYLPEDYTVTKLYDRDGTFSTAAVTNHINNNLSSLGLHCGHCNYFYLMGWSQIEIDYLENTMYPFFSSGGCHTLAFEEATSGPAESVGEHALFAQGAFSTYLGHSRYGFSNWTEFIQQLLVGIFTEEIGSICASLTYSRDQLAHTVSHPVYRWEFYELIFAGDPEIHLINLSAGYSYLPGDANMYNGAWPPTVIGADVTYLVNHFRGIVTSAPCLFDGFWCSADANGDCNVIGSDVTKLVNYFRGITTIQYCLDFEPAWPHPDSLPPEAPEDWPNCEPSP
jgi:hypothetical protein